MAEQINIQVVYALPEQQEFVAVALSQGSTVLQALQASGLLEKHGLELSTSKFGIYGKLAKLVEDRYAGWKAPLGQSMLDGKMSLEAVAAHVVDRNTDTMPVSGRQELLENLLNSYI